MEENKGQNGHIFKLKDGTEIRVGDYVFVHNNDSNLNNWIAKVRKKKYVRKRKTYVEIQWYYRKTDLEGCSNRHLTGKDELFESDHSQNLEPTTFNGKCEVHSMKTYLQKIKDKTYTSGVDFFSRYCYNSNSLSFKKQKDFA
ncbi:hypothetical protein LXL04_023161 [Taraxacum kok-saghyz]